MNLKSFLVKMKKYTIIAAGGSGQRMGNETPKQFLQIKNKSLLWHSVNAFTKAFDDISIIVVAPALHIEKAKEVCAGFSNISFAEGGSTRFQSAKNGLEFVKESSIVFVHDAVRCLVTDDLVKRCYDQAIEKGSAIPSIAVNDSIRIMEDGSHRVIDRNSIRIIQTPQTFKSEIILPAFSVEDNELFTDEATVVEASGRSVELIEGEQTNIKITRPVDILIAEKIMEQRAIS
jgi:2-C-methyl-D-erythritol 4-phosphate cytidylyltransferase